MQCHVGDYEYTTSRSAPLKLDLPLLPLLPRRLVSWLALITPPLPRRRTGHAETTEMKPSAVRAIEVLRVTI